MQIASLWPKRQYWQPPIWPALASLFAWSLVLTASPSLMSGIMGIQWPPFQGLPLETWAQRLWALGVWHVTFLAPVVGVCFALAMLYTYLRRRGGALRGSE